MIRHVDRSVREYLKVLKVGAKEEASLLTYSFC